MTLEIPINPTALKRGQEFNLGINRPDRAKDGATISTSGARFVNIKEGRVHYVWGFNKEKKSVPIKGYTFSVSKTITQDSLVKLIRQIRRHILDARSGFALELIDKMFPDGTL